jgi:hypothetical protein
LDTELLPWSVLCREGRAILKSVERRWRSLLNDASVTEWDLHRYLADHAALFFGQELVVISRADLGSDYQADLVIASDEASYGIDYTFVEIESPHASPYTCSGDPCARLTHAIQQVLNWKTWLKRHRGHVRKFFPSGYFGWDEFTNLSFSVVIGRRTSPNTATAKRNVLAREMGIKIHSFDYLTERLRKGLSFLWDLSTLTEGGQPGIIVRNQLANPFARAYSWRAWKEVVGEPHFEHEHFVALNAQRLLAHRTYSRELQGFTSLWKSLPLRTRVECLSRVVARSNWR